MKGSKNITAPFNFIPLTVPLFHGFMTSRPVCTKPLEMLHFVHFFQIISFNFHYFQTILLMKNFTRSIFRLLIFAVFPAQLLVAQECLSGGCLISTVQFPSATQSTTSSTFVTVSTVIYAGEWQRYNVTSGNTYEWSLCSSDGGSASYDSQLTLYQDNGTTILCYSDDNCSDDGKIQWTANFTGQVRTQVNQYNCTTNSVATTLVWRQVSGSSLNCGSAINMSCGTSVTSGNLATAGGIYNPPSTSCGFNTPGNEKLYSFTTTSAGTYTLEVTGVNGGTGYIDYFIKTAAGGCGSSGWTCIDDFSAIGSAGLALAASTQYYILLDAESATGTANHTFRITCPPPPPANDNCSGATNLTPVPGVPTNPGTQNSAGATSSGVTIPTCSGFTASSALDVWYRFTTDPNGGNATAVVTGLSGFDPVVQCLSGTCGSPVNVGCIDGSTTGGTETLNLTGLSASTTYYLRVYGWAGTTGTFNISISGTALPLELASFRGKTEPSYNMLEWETITEKNVQWHIVERSTDGEKWSETGKVQGQMNSQAPLKYELEDRTPVAKAYYRLRSVDYDGAENVSNTILLTRKSEHFGITAAFPSPAKDRIMIQFESLQEENVRIRLSDVAGRVVLEQEFAADKGINETPVDLTSLQAGIYIVNIFNADSAAEPVRIVKE